MVSRTQVIIDAKGKKLGRVASEAARLLRGKDVPTFAPHLDQGAWVTIVHAGKVDFSKRKREQKVYWRHSGHLGGIQFTSAEALWQKDASEVMRRSISGMLPKNRLRARMMRRLSIFEGDKE